MRKGRLFLAALVAVGLAPGIVWRSPPPPKHWQAPVVIRPVPTRPAHAGPLVLERGWRLSSKRIGFGGYSALLALGPDSMAAFSDGGQMLMLGMERGRPVAGKVRPFLRHDPDAAKEDYDVEGAARDPATGTIWLSKEMVNAIERFDGDMASRGTVRPAAMADWDENGGAEAFVRLADGRFVVVQEGARAWMSDHHRGLVFGGDPVDPATPPPRGFALELPDGFRPVDMAQVPDGRVLILLRRLDFPFPPQFASALAIADPAELRAGNTWRTRLLGVLGKGWPRENYEGMVVDPAPAADGSVGLWLISDDNLMVRFQRTLLLRVRFRP